MYQINHTCLIKNCNLKLVYLLTFNFCVLLYSMSIIHTVCVSFVFLCMLISKCTHISYSRYNRLAFAFGCLVTSWSNHIARTTAKALQLFNFLRHNWSNCSPSVKASTYLTIVCPVLKYAASFWDPYQQNDILSLEKV